MASAVAPPAIITEIGEVPQNRALLHRSTKFDHPIPSNTVILEAYISEVSFAAVTKVTKYGIQRHYADHNRNIKAPLWRRFAFFMIRSFRFQRHDHVIPANTQRIKSR